MKKFFKNEIENYLSLETSQEYLDAVAEELNCKKEDLIEVNGVGEYLLHPLVAIDVMAYFNLNVNWMPFLL